MDAQPKRVFRSPSLLEEFGAASMAMLVIVLLLVVILGGGIAHFTGGPWILLAFLGITILGILSIAAALGLTRGKVILDEEGLVEYNSWNVARRFGYGQIFDIKNGVHANSLVIGYYPRLENGTIDTLHPRRTRLISVKDDVGLKMALARRMTASGIDSAVGKDRLPGLLLLVFLLVVLPILLYWALPWF